MVIEIPKGTSPNKIKKILFTKRNITEQNKKNTISSFFGKIPDIEDGLLFQKKVRSEWK